MKTYQDWLKVANSDENARMAFIKSAIEDFKGSPEYRNALDGDAYYNGRNTTIKRYEKILFNALGQAVPDLVSANHKLASRFFYRDVMQAASVLLGNGVKWASPEAIGGNALGIDFDAKLLKAYKIAQRQGAAYGFYNNGRVEIYKYTEFMPLVDEEDGSIKAGIRFWQIASNKPLRATMFELDGYTEYMWNDKGVGSVKQEKRGYKMVVGESKADGEIIYNYENYPTFPVVPLYVNEEKESELLPLRSKIDCRDLISSGYANDIDDASIIYWTITNSGGMDDADLVAMLDKLRKLHATQTDGDVNLQSHSVEPSYQGREAILTRLDADLYEDAMAVNTKDLSSRNATATEIIAAYEPLNEKLDDHETYITTFILGLLAVADVEDMPSYDRAVVMNKAEEINTILAAAMYLPEEYITSKIVTLFGDKDALEDIKAQQAGESINRLTGGNNNPDGDGNE